MRGDIYTFPSPDLKAQALSSGHTTMHGETDENVSYYVSLLLSRVPQTPHNSFVCLLQHFGCTFLPLYFSSFLVD